MPPVRKATLWFALVLWCGGCFALLQALQPAVEVSADALTATSKRGGASSPLGTPTDH